MGRNEAKKLSSRKDNPIKVLRLSLSLPFEVIWAVYNMATLAGTFYGATKIYTEMAVTLIQRDNAGLAIDSPAL
jgi:hypothetical protein